MIVTCLLGFGFGLVGSMPLTGPVAVMVLARALRSQYRQALEVGWASAAVESIYAGVAYWGFTTFLARHRLVLPISHAVSAVVLMTVGLYFALGPGPKAHQPEREGHALMLGLTAAAFNPTLLATWSGAVAFLYGKGLASPHPLVGIPFGLTAGLGNAAWQLVLVGTLRHLGPNAPPRPLAIAIRAMGALLVGVGVWAAIDFVRTLSRVT